MALGITYLKAIEAAGGLPVVMPPMAEDAIEPLLDRLDGICLSGGPDLDPALYEAEPHPELGPIEPDLDRFELAVAARADAREMPILAICRGTQALNIVRGGALHQHLPDLSTEVAHRQTDPRHRAEPPGRGRARTRSWPRRSAAARSRSPTSTPSTTRRSTGSATGCGSAPGPPTGRSRRSRTRAAAS